MGDTYVPRFWPPFFTLAGSSTIFLGYFFSSTNTKTIFCGIKTTNSYRIRSFRPQISFFPRSFWVQFSAASGTPPSFFGPSTPPPPPPPVPPTDQKCADSSTYWQFFNYRPPGRFRYTTVFSGRDRENMMPKTRYIAIYAYIYRYIYILIFSIVDLFSISIGNTKNHVATLVCLEWHSVKICLTCPL